MEVDLRGVRGENGQFLLRHGVGGFPRERFHFDEPLRLGERFQRRPALVAGRDLVRVAGIGLFQDAFRAHCFRNLFARLVHFQAGERPGKRREAAVLADHDLRAGHFVLVPLPDLKVRRVVRGRYLYDAGAERGIHRVVRDDAQLDGSEHVFGLDLAPDVFRVAPVARVHRERRVAELRFRPHGRQGERPVLDVVERIAALDVFHFEVRQRRPVLRAPVYDAQAAVDEPVAVHLHERILRAAHDVRVQREFFPRPVARRAKFPYLHLHIGFVLLREIPDGLPERFARHGRAVVALAALARVLFPLLVEDDLRFKSRVVGAREPERPFPAHAREADHDVLEREEHRVPDMQVAVRVRRRHDDRERLLPRTGQCVGIEIAGRFPCAVGLFFNFQVVVARLHVDE